jgi:hypothetical protein
MSIKTCWKASNRSVGSEARATKGGKPNFADFRTTRVDIAIDGPALRHTLGHCCHHIAVRPSEERLGKKIIRINLGTA